MPDKEREEIVCTACGTIIDLKELLIPIETPNQRLDKNEAANGCKPCSRLDKSVFLRAVKELRTACNLLKLPAHVLQSCIYLFIKARGYGLLHGRTIPGCAGACLYIICRNSKIPRSLSEIMESFKGATDNDIKACYKAIIKETGMKIPGVNPRTLIPHFANKLGMSPRVTLNALVTMKQIQDNFNQDGKDPKGVMAAVLYVTCRRLGEKCTQVAISRACNVHETTLRCRIKEIKRFLEKLNKDE